MFRKTYKTTDTKTGDVQEAERKAGEQKIKDEQFGSQLIDRLL